MYSHTKRGGIFGAHGREKDTVQLTSPIPTRLYGSTSRNH
jgi:hypothetical protein